MANKPIDVQLSVEDGITDELVAMARRVVGIRTGYVTVGIHDGTSVYPETGETLLQVAFYQEFGTAHIPPRSFLRTPIAKNMNRIEKVRNACLKQVVNDGADPMVAFGRLGMMLVAVVQEAIARGIKPKLDEKTMQEKRRLGYPDTALIRTGKLYSSIGYRIHLASKTGDVVFGETKTYAAHKQG